MDTVRVLMPGVLVLMPTLRLVLAVRMVVVVLMSVRMRVVVPMRVLMVMRVPLGMAIRMRVGVRMRMAVPVRMAMAVRVMSVRVHVSLRVDRVVDRDAGGLFGIGVHDPHFAIVGTSTYATHRKNLLRGQSTRRRAEGEARRQLLVAKRRMGRVAQANMSSTRQIVVGSRTVVRNVEIDRPPMITSAME